LITASVQLILATVGSVKGLVAEPPNTTLFLSAFGGLATVPATLGIATVIRRDARAAGEE
jgi:hypothetical protein